MFHQRERDLIVRQIKQLAALVARVLTGKMLAPEAEEELRRSTREMLGVEAELLGALDARSAADLLARSERIALYARIVSAQAEVRARTGDAPGANEERRRALQLWIEAGLRGPLDDEGAAAVAALEGKVARSDLPERHRAWLAKRGGAR